MIAVSRSALLSYFMYVCTHTGFLQKVVNRSNKQKWIYFASNFLLDTVGTCITWGAKWTDVLYHLRQVFYTRPSEGYRCSKVLCIAVCNSWGPDQAQSGTLHLSVLCPGGSPGTMGQPVCWAGSNLAMREMLTKSSSRKLLLPIASPQFSHVRSCIYLHII